VEVQFAIISIRAQSAGYGDLQILLPELRKFPVQTLIRVPVGAYGGAGLIIAAASRRPSYPSRNKNSLSFECGGHEGIDEGRLSRPHPVIMLEHKGLYWSKSPGTEEARRWTSEDYILPLGKANTVLTADPERVAAGETCCIITYGMGVWWSRAAAQDFPGSLKCSTSDPLSSR